MIAELQDILTCSNLTCSNPPVWYLLAENWTAHIGLGALFAVLHPRLGWALVLLLVFKEVAGDIPRDPRASVFGDGMMDLLSTTLGVLIAQGRQNRKSPQPEGREHGKA